MSAAFSRRVFLVASAFGGAAARPGARQASPVGVTAADLIGRIRAAFGPTWRDTPTDTFHAGSPDVLVRGVATSVMSTLAVLQQAATSGLNLVITHEPTFYTGNDNVSTLTSDPLYLRKLEFVRSNGLAVFRLHDNWHSRRPEPMGQGLAESLGWGAARSTDDPDVFVIQRAAVSDVLRLIEQKLKVRAPRLIGRVQTSVTRVGFLPGTPPSPTAAARLFAKVDLIIAGEQREWEGIYYAHDLVTSGEAKAMITLGHAISEDPGMKLCADWLRTFITDVPVDWIPAGEPFSRT